MRGFLTFLKYFALGILLLLILPVFPPLDVEFEGWNVHYHAFEGNLSPNNALDEAEILSSEAPESELGQLKGPKSMVVKDNFLYTGVYGGNIVRLDLKDPFESPWESVVFLGQGHCQHQYQEDICGRPLGLHLDGEGNLVVADAVFGLLKVDLDTKEIIPLVPATMEIDGKMNTLTTSSAIARDGTIYYTSSSTRFPLYEGIFELFSAGSGRLLEYNPKTNSSQVLLDNIRFANGVALSSDEDFLLVNEVGKYRILKYHLKGDLTGQVETLLETPGGPDIVRNIGKDRFLVGIPTPLLPHKFSVLADVFTKYSLMARFFVRIVYGLKMLPELINQYVFTHEWLQVAAYWIANFETHLGLAPRYGLIIEVDSVGKILKTWHGPSGKVPFVCEGTIHDGYMYVGSPFNEFMARIKYIP